jgi:hypothetical protein
MHNPVVLLAFNPWYGISFLIHHVAVRFFREWGATPSPCVVTLCAHRLDIYGPANPDAPPITWLESRASGAIIRSSSSSLPRDSPETWETQTRIAEAKRLTTCVVDHLQYLLDIQENNAIVLYSDTLSKQIPKSIAANAFNVVREAMHQIEIVRVCALWDSALTIERESIQTVIELIDDPKALDALAEQARAGHPGAAATGPMSASRTRSCPRSET